MNTPPIRSHFANWRDWELNPIVVKELRQAVRSWAVTGMFLLFLAGLFIVSAIFFVTGADSDPDEQLGSDLFGAFAFILAIASLFFIPLYLGIRVAAERQENNPDLFYVSTLSPARIILGKFLCGVYMVVLFFSACMPFMAFTNLLRGVDLPTVFLILFYLFLTVCTINTVAIFFGCIPVSRPLKILLGLLCFILSFPFIGTVLSYVFRFMRLGIGSTMGGRDFWIGTFTAIAIYAAVTGLFYVMAVALVSPPSSNRALPVRIYTTVVWFLTGLLTLAWVIKTGPNAIVVWLNAVFFLLMAALIVVVSNSDALSNRVRRAIPRAPWKRFFAFLFYNGAAGGLIWVAALTAVTFLVVSNISGPTAGHSNDWMPQAAFATYMFAYALAALFIHRTFLPNRPAKLVGLFTVSIVAVCALAPSIILFFLNELTAFSIERLELGNVFNVFSMRDDGRLVIHFYFALGCLAVIATFNARWFFKQRRNFAPPPKDAPPVIAYELLPKTEPLAHVRGSVPTEPQP